MTSEAKDAEASAEEGRDGESDDDSKAPAGGAARAAERGWGFPAFAREFPRDVELDALVAKFADGDYLAVRKGAPRLATKDGVRDDVKQAALLLRARVEPDRTARTFFALTAALLVFLTVWWVTHDGPEHRGTIAPPAPPAVEFVK